MRSLACFSLIKEFLKTYNEFITKQADRSEVSRKEVIDKISAASIESCWRIMDVQHANALLMGGSVNLKDDPVWHKLFGGDF